MEWTPRTVEDELLYAYWAQKKGRLYTEVPRAGPQGGPAWVKDSTIRRLDGVHVHTNADTEGILPFIGHAEEFRRDI